MEFIAISDLHGNLIEIKDKADILLIAGDIVPLQVQSSMENSKAWFKDKFIPWCNSIDVNKVIFIGGNHDRWIEKKQEEVISLLPDNIIYLLNNFVYVDENIRIYGTPLCSIFGNWSFMYPKEEQRILLNYQKDEDDKNIKTILLSHDSPYGFSDVLLDKTCPWCTDKHIGNPIITELMERLNPEYVIHGHLHSTNHEVEKYNDKTKIICVSLLGENYKIQYKPYKFSL